MTLRHSAYTALGCTLVLSLSMGPATRALSAQDAARAPLTLGGGRVSIAGTSNVHEYTAQTTTVRLTRVQLGAAVSAATLWDEIVTPGALEAFEIAIPAATLTSPKDGLDKNMHKALKVAGACRHHLPPAAPRAGAAPARSRRIGVLQIAGVEREVTLR